jgi:proteic killer suppression protein
LYSIQSPPSFRRVAKKSFNSHPDLKSRFKSIIEILRLNPKHPSLKLHALTGKYKSLHAISLTYKFRITFIIKFDNRAIILIDIGSHDHVYR